MHSENAERAVNESTAGPVQLRFRTTDLPGVVLIEPAVHRDGRGFFLESYNREKYAAGGVDATFVQDNHSFSIGSTLRGLHAQRHHPQGKLVRAVQGEIFDVAVDIRRGSPTFGKWVGFPLSAENFRQLWVPPGFAHGFCALSDGVQIEYKVTEFYDPRDEVVIAWNDPQLAIDWPIDEPTLSPRDRQGVRLGELVDSLPVWEETQDGSDQGDGDGA